MFRQVRFQTGEMKEIINCMKDGDIPCMDVDDYDEFHQFVKQLKGQGIYPVEGLPHDKNARNRVKEEEFEFRAAFYTQKITAEETAGKKLLYIDFYFEPFIEETYDSVSEL